MATNPARVRSSSDPVNGVSTPVKVSDCWSSVRPRDIGVSVKLVRPSKTPGSARWPSHSR